jgi:hypothetical protein
MPTTNPHVKVYVTPEQKQALQQAAQTAGFHSLSEYISHVLATTLPGYEPPKRRGTYLRDKQTADER